MKKAAIWSLLPALTMLAACSEKVEQISAEQSEVSDAAVEAAPQNKFGFQESLHQSPSFDGKADARLAAQDAAATTAAAAKKTAENSSVQSNTSGPKIAYAYSFGFRISSESMATLQRRHAQMCEKLGATSCRVMQMSQSGGQGEFAYGELRLEVAAPQARAFGVELEKATEGIGGQQISSSISGEDLAKQIIDTEARLQARLLLRGRLMGLLASHKGSVAELVEAERAVAEVNEEIDEAQRQLKEMNGRVDFSRVTISYESQSRIGGSFLHPIVSALSSLGSILGWVIAILIVLTISLIPISLFVLTWRWAWRKSRTVIRQFAAKAASATTSAEPDS